MLSRAALSETNGFEGDHVFAFEVVWIPDLFWGRQLSIYVTSVQFGIRVPEKLPATSHERFIKLRFILQVSRAGQPVFCAFWSLVAPEKFPVQLFENFG